MGGEPSAARKAAWPLEALEEQLDVLEQAVTRMHDAAVAADARALLANGAFLADRFATSTLDLPD